ncbi:hypothetical protein CBM2626_A130146 [Cupriavidus taiwanensis]|nr:hypothetical protein CBM2626_A130146 [Cupriavidus taiwanensis]
MSPRPTTSARSRPSTKSSGDSARSTRPCHTCSAVSGSSCGLPGSLISTKCSKRNFTLPFAISRYYEVSAYSRDLFVCALQHCPDPALSDIGQTRAGWSPRVNAAPG